MTEARVAEQRRWIALALLAVAQFVVVLDASIVNVALPTIGRALDFSQGNLQWVVNAYVLTFGGFLLLGGRVADLLGRRRVFMGGLILFALASLAGGLAQSEGQLIVARAVQGLGAAILSPAALSIVTTTFRDGAERNKALGVWGAVAGAGGAAGVLLGGILTDTIGWEWVFWVNVPVGIGAAALTPTLIAESRAATATRTFDLAGAVTVTAALSVLVYALVDANSAGWGSPADVGLLALSLALLGGFVVAELRSRAPLVPFSFFADRTRTGANVVGLLVGASLFSMFFFISLYMQQVLGYSPIKAGLSYLPLALSIIVSAGVASQLVTRVGLQAGAGRGPRADRRGAALVLPGLGRRQLPCRHPRSFTAGRGRARVLLRPGDDRRGLRSHRSGRRPGQRADQHRPAGRRRARPGAALDDRHLADLRRDGGGRRGEVGSSGGPYRRLPVSLPRRGGVGGPRPGRRPRPDPRP